MSNLAIPAGGIDSDIGDTLSVQSWGSRSGKSYTSRKSREGSSHTRQEFGSIMRFLPPTSPSFNVLFPQACYPQGGLVTDMLSYRASQLRGSHLYGNHTFDSCWHTGWFRPCIRLLPGSCCQFCSEILLLLQGHQVVPWWARSWQQLRRRFKLGIQLRLDQVGKKMKVKKWE